MKCGLFVGVVAAAVIGAGVSAQAATLSHEFMAGHGQPQDIFTISTSNGIELGLGAQQRGVSGQIPVGTSGNYFVQPSVTANWNFDFSIDLNPTNAATSLQLSDITALITVTGPGSLSGTYNPIFFINDNSGGPTLAQNSENLSFNSIFSTPVGSGAPLGYNPQTQGTYIFTLDVRSATGALLASDTMNVIVGTPTPTGATVPVPAAAYTGMITLAVAGVAGLVSKKRRAGAD